MILFCLNIFAMQIYNFFIYKQQSFHFGQQKKPLNQRLFKNFVTRLLSYHRNTFHSLAVGGVNFHHIDA